MPSLPNSGADGRARSVWWSKLALAHDRPWSFVVASDDGTQALGALYRPRTNPGRRTMKVTAWPLDAVCGRTACRTKRAEPVRQLTS